MKLKKRIIQIIPAPPNLFAKFRDTDAPEGQKFFTNRVIVMALVEEGDGDERDRFVTGLITNDLLPCEFCEDDNNFVEFTDDPCTPAS